MKEIFFNFLKKKGAYDAFVRNFLQTLHDRGYFERILHEDYLRCAFFWDETPEGQSYWVELNNEWRKELEQ